MSKALLFGLLLQITFEFDLWVKYWPNPKQTKTTLAQEISDYLSTKSLTVPVSAITFKDVAAQADDLGQHVHVTVTGITLTKSDIDHDKLAVFLGLNP